jgi:hypothetical protein
MERFLLYGARTSDVNAVADALQARLGCEFEERDSDYLGAYRLARLELTEIKVMSALDPDSEPLEAEFDAYQTLVYVTTQEEFEALDAMPVPGGALELLRDE